MKPEKPVLERFDLARRKLDVIAEPVSGYAVSGDGTRLVVRDGSTLRVLRTDRSGASAPTDGPVDAGADEYPVDTRRIVVTVDPTAEWHQMFDEAARLMRDHFWVADMAGVDWAAEVARYRPARRRRRQPRRPRRPAVGAGGRAGHVARLRDAAPAGTARTGGPGCWAPTWNPSTTAGGWRGCSRRRPPIPAARSPLSSPGVDVRAGDVIVEVGGQPVDPQLGPAPLLVGRAGELVELTVRSGSDDDTEEPAASSCARCAPRPRCATRTGWPGGGPRSSSAPPGGWATCTCPT